MSFANPAAPAKWFLYMGIFIRWLCVYLFFANAVSDFEYEDILLPEGYSEFTRGAMIGLYISLALSLAEVVWLYLKKQNNTGASKRHDLNQLVVRYFLAYIFFSYGIDKILDLQFSSAYFMMDQTLAEAPGNNLAWRFFDYSYKYKLFIGLGQVIAAILLLSRRTTTLATVLLLPIISNIVMVNFALGIGVTFFSTCYLLCTIYLMICDFDRLTALFISNRAFPDNKTLKISRYQFISTPLFRIIKPVFIFSIIAWPVSAYWRNEFNNSKVFIGSFKVNNFLLQNNSDDSLNGKWDKVYFEKWANGGFIKRMDGKRISFRNYTFDGSRKIMNLTFRDTIHYKNINVNYNIETDSSISAIGIWGKDSIRFNMKRYFSTRE